jgi:two-component system sensor histidine kinase RegB
MGEAFVSTRAHELVERAIAGLEAQPAIRVEIGAEVRELALEVPPRAVLQALQGILKNAQDASVEHGTVTLTVSRVGERIEFAVRDKGAGMPSEILERVGEPFYTTKAPGKGMGLGLFLARTVVERLGGVVTLDSVIGVGTTARLAVPFNAGPTA